MRTSGKTALLAKPNLHRAGPGGRKKHIKRGAKGLSLSLSLCLSLPLSLSCTLGHSSLHIFGSACPHASRMDLPVII